MTGHRTPPDQHLPVVDEEEISHLQPILGQPAPELMISPPTQVVLLQDS